MKNSIFNAVCKTRYLALLTVLTLLLTLGVENVWGQVSLPYEWTVSAGKGSLPSGVTHSGLGSNYAADHAPYYLKYDGAGDYIQVYTNKAAGDITFRVKKIGGASNSTFVVEGCATADGTYVEINSFTISGSSGAIVECQTTTSINSSYRYFRIRMSAKGANVGFGYLNITTPCTKVDVTGGSAVILPKGTTTYTTSDWGNNGAPTGGYPASATVKNIKGYCVTFTNAYENNQAAGLQVKASGGSISMEIVSTNGVDVEVVCSGTNGFSIALTGATTKTGQTGTATISTTTTEPTLTITKNTSSVGYIKTVKITPKAAPCDAPTAIASSAVGNTGATLTVTDDNNTNKYDFCCNTSSSATPSVTASVSGSKAKAITGLAYGTKYYYWARTDCGSSTYSDWYPSSSPSYFTTTCPNPTSISAGSVTSSGVTFTIVDGNSPALSTYGIYYSKSSTAPTSGTSATTTSTSTSKSVTGLESGQTYYYWVRGQGPNANATSWVSGGSFTTLVPCTTAPTVTAGSAGTITSTTAAVSCASGITSLGTGGCTITSYGFVYGTSSNPTTANSTQQVGTSYASIGVSFNTSLTGLTEGQLYYVRPYATNGYGTGYGTQTSFGTPKITPSGSSLAFGSKTVGTDDNELTFTVSGTYLQSDISIAKTGTNAAMFSIDKTTVTQTDGTAASTTITVTYAPSAAGSHSATLTLTSTNAANKTVTLSGTGVYVDTFIDALQNTSGYTEASPHTESSTYSTPTLTDKSATTSGTCEQQHWHFMGWITKAKYDAGTTIADGDLQTPTTASNATYYAVWAKGSAGSSGSFTISASDITSGPASYSTTETKFTKLATNDIGYKNVSYNNANTPSNWAAQTRIQFKKDATNYGELYNLVAISGLTKIRIYEESNCASVLTIYTGTTSKATTSTLSWPGSATGTESLSISKSGGGTISFTSNYYDLNVSSGHTFFYIKNANSSVAYPIKIVVYYSTVTYSDYKANCCANLITLAAPTITGSGCSITFDKSSPVETCSAAQDVTTSVSVTNGYKVTALSFALSTGTYTIDTDPATVLPLTASQDFTLTFAQNHAAATLTTTATVVALQDKYYDYMHDNALKHTKSGNYGTAPTLDSKSVATEAGCMDNHYKFIGWVISTDVNDDGSLKGGYTLIPGGATGKYATGATYIAVWAEEE